MQAPKVTVLGSINMDLVVACDRIPQPGETVLAKSAVEVSGGKGANQAVAASRAGAEVSLIGRVGDDVFRDRLLKSLRQQNIDLQAVQTTNDCSCGLAIISVETSGQNAITVIPGANNQVTVADVVASRRTIESSDILMVQLELPIDAVIEAIRIARRAGVRVILDPAPAPQEWPDELLQVDLLCPNESEAAALVGHTVCDFPSAESAARTLHDRGATNVAITMGSQGTLLLHQDQTEMFLAYPVDVVDTTAAGDAFAGALAVHWAQTDNLRQAVEFANAAGALAASNHGAQPSMGTRQEIENLRSTR